MKIYLVGGAVRDRLLGRPVVERDWVVVGATPAEMRRLGFRQVGKDFPVFLHPKTQEEYALARRERKTGPGYAGFAFDASPEVTLEEDLMRRDLTINAIAESSEGELIDPFGGQADLQARWLRHVSDAFSEDPVRILRVARFAARFAPQGFRVAPETLILMQTMAVSGEVDALVAERVWKELERALAESRPDVFFEVLEASHALPRLFPGAILQGMAALRRSAALTEDTVTRFAALSHGLSQHETENLCQRFRVPNEYWQLAVLVSRYQSAFAEALSLDATQIVQLLQSIDAFRRKERFQKWLTALHAVCGPEGEACLRHLQKCFNAAQSVDVASLLAGAKGEEIATRIHAARIQKVAEHL